MTTSTLPSRPARTYGWRSWTEVARETLIGAAIGIAIPFVESGGTKKLPEAVTFGRNVIIVITIVLVARLLETTLSWAIEQSRIPTAFRAIIYAIGGWLGYFLALATTVMIWGPDDDDLDFGSYHFIYTLSAAAVAATLTGLILHHNRKRNDRLAQTIARLKEHEFAEKELEIAREMQQRLLPPSVIEHERLTITARTEAAHLVGGDFYDVVRLADGTLAVLIADVSGKGIAASLIMATCKAMIPFFASNGTAAEVMSALNRKLCEQLQRREFVAMLLARIDPSSGDADLVNAGMPDPFVIRAGGALETVEFRGDRLPAGARRASEYLATPVRLAPGDRLLMFSDGLPEAQIGGAPIGYQKTEEMAARLPSIDAIFDELRTSGASVEDDLTALEVRRN